MGESEWDMYAIGVRVARVRGLRVGIGVSYRYDVLDVR